jgi:hypothetical protein
MEAQTDRNFYVFCAIVIQVKFHNYFLIVDIEIIPTSMYQHVVTSFLLCVAAFKLAWNKEKLTSVFPFPHIHISLNPLTK